MKNNTKRIIFLDVLKCIALVSMVLIHMSDVLLGLELFSEKVDGTWLEAFVSIVYIVSPSIFMFSMGASLNLSKRNDSKHYLLRGLKIFIIGLVLNFLRGAILYLGPVITYDTFTFKDYLLNVIDWTLGNDILMFAGLFFVIYGLLLKFKTKKDLALIITSLVFFIGSLFIPVGLSTGYDLLDSFLGNFIFIGESYFPILTWTIIPTLGYFFFKYFNNVSNKNRYMLFTLASAATTLLVTLLITLLTDTFEERFILFGENGFYFDLPTMLITLSINYIYIVGIYYLSKYIEKSNILTSLIVFESSNITIIYIAHWLIIVTLATILLAVEAELPFGALSLIFGTIILVVSSLIALGINKLKDKKNGCKQ